MEIRPRLSSSRLRPSTPSPRARLRDAHIAMAVPSRPLAGRVDRMSEANAGGVGGLFLLRASKSPPTRLASLATLPANGREGKGERAHHGCVHPLARKRGESRRMDANRRPSRPSLRAGTSG